MLQRFGCCSSEHEYAIVDTVNELMEKRYTCYLEYEIPLDERKRGYRLVVDIFARRGLEECLIEVGSLSYSHGKDRLQMLKSIYPNAKIIHVTQWKNFLTTSDWEYANLSKHFAFVETINSF